MKKNSNISDLHRVAEAVLTYYVEAKLTDGSPRCSLGKLIRENRDEDDAPTEPQARNISLPPISAVEYRIDCELAFKHILATNPEQLNTLLTILVEYGLPIAQPEPLPTPADKALLMHRIGKLAEARKLAPGLYFRRVRK